MSLASGKAGDCIEFWAGCRGCTPKRSVSLCKRCGRYAVYIQNVKLDITMLGNMPVLIACSASSCVQYLPNCVFFLAHAKPSGHQHVKTASSAPERAMAIVCNGLRSPRSAKHTALELHLQEIEFEHATQEPVMSRTLKSESDADLFVFRHPCLRGW